MNDVHVTIDLEAPVHRVWEYLTDRDKLARWLMTSDLTPGVGARFTFSAPPSGGWDGRLHCEVTEAIENERLAFTWNANDIGAETLVTIRLESIKAGTRLTLTHTGFDGALPGARGRHAAGWTNALKSLEDVLCGPRQGYDWSAFQITRYVEAPLSAVFALWSTSAGLQRFWADRATCNLPDGTVRAPGESFRHGDRVGLTFPTGATTELEIINIERDRFVTFTFGRDYGWVRVALSRDGDRTRIVLRQFGLPINHDAPWDVHVNARGWWIFNLMNLEAVLLHDHDLRVRQAGVENGLGARFVVGDGEKDQVHDWTSFDVHLWIAAPPQEVLSRWRTADGITSFFVRDASLRDPSGSARAADTAAAPGDSYEWRFLHDFRLEGRVLESTPDRFAFTFGDPLRVDVTAQPRAAGTLLHLRQGGMRDDPEDRVHSSLNCRSCWIYFLTALKCRVECGVDLRDRCTDTADSVSVGYNLRS
jgi:uncharacterized protein YndB with AHSA1/START domain